MKFFSVAVVSAALLLSLVGCGRLRRSANAKTQPVPVGENYVPAGTMIKVRTAGMISTRAVAPGERIEVQLAEPLEVEGQTKVAAGATAILSIVDSKPGIPIGTAPKMQLKVTQLRRSILDRVEVNTATLNREGSDIAPGSVLTFRLETPAQLETDPPK